MIEIIVAFSYIILYNYIIKYEGGNNIMSAYSDWKCGALTDEEYWELSRMEYEGDDDYGNEVNYEYEEED